ncbi:DUF3800 domain-containing protein [Achromobacter veterisilvae]|jgi:hypothetical protein|uniref:DUF3800 domain-containing protein n=1 Tax=Achromobacter veterisilvae TaxID=2069367 RepID=A0A446CCF4_9BURK|nr:DUF3800 domain-containing protein [Achromobacter veterisilvae]SSW65538.1 hypothetical protein AVE30378_01701 [Achromobacter veterisilvae]
MHYVMYLDEFGHIGPFVSRDHGKHKTSPVFGFGGLVLPVEAVREFAIYFYKLKCRLLKFELERQAEPAYRWEKKGAQLYTVGNVEKYRQLRTATGRLLNQIKQIGGHVIYSGEWKSADTASHRPAEVFKHHLLRIVRLTDRFFSARQATFMLLIDEQQAGSGWREMNVEACTLAMFEDAAHRCRTLIEPLIQGESYLFQTLQCADWICGLVGRLCAYQVASSQYQDWEIFHRYFYDRLQAAALPCSGLERRKHSTDPSATPPSV